MGTRYTKKNLGDPNWSKPNNYKIKQNDAIYDVEIVPNKGVKGDISAQPFNDKNAEDIENALVSLDDDLAFVEADYINNAEHALKQNITDNGLNTTNKTVVGAINEVKSEGEYHDLLQDDAIAIVNNKINALPMNGSLKNIRTSLVGIPTTFTNIDMFNTKQTVTNYQPLSLDYKGAANPEVILMKTIGDYTFDFAIEATHTNGTDTTIILEAWVDGVLYDTATRTLVGGSNQINGITGFFTYSKGTDTVPSEIYFRFRASQGNTSANKTLINTNLLGSSADFTFTDTDHVTGTNLNEPTYNGATTSFIINDIRGDLNTLDDVVVKSVDGHLPDIDGNVISKQEWSLDELGLDGTWSITDVPGNIVSAYNAVVALIGNEMPFTIRQGMWNDPTKMHYEFSKAIVDDLTVSYGIGLDSLFFTIDISFRTVNGITNASYTTANFIEVKTAGRTFTKVVDIDNWENSYWLDEVGAPHCDVVCDIQQFMLSTQGSSIDAPYRDYISGITFQVSDFDDSTGNYTVFDGDARYVPRVKPVSKPPNLDGTTDGDTVFAFTHSLLASINSDENPILLDYLANMYVRVDYGVAGDAYPNGIRIEGLLNNNSPDQILSMVIIHYGKVDWSNVSQQAPFVVKASYTPTLLNQPIVTPKVGDNMEEASILKEVLDNV